MLTTTFLLVARLLAVEQAAPGDCLQYEPAVVILTGAVQRLTFPGPPNFESIARGDTPETGWYLQLERPACVQADTESETSNVSESGVRKVQLVLNASMYSQYRRLVGKRVLVSGTLFHAHTGHHHTKVLVTVKNMRRVD